MAAAAVCVPKEERPVQMHEAFLSLIHISEPTRRS